MLAMFTVPAASSAATQMTASVDPTSAGSAQHPQPVDLHLAVSLNTDASGLPTGVAHAIAFALPTEFVETLGAFATCPPDALMKQGPDRCPPGSIVGSAKLAGTPTALPTTHSGTDRGVLVHTGDHKIGFWWHISNPVTLQGVLDATVTQVAAPFGPLVTFDLSPIANGTDSGGLEIRTNRLEVNFLRATIAAVSSSPAISPPKQTCMQRAARMRSRRKRRAALRRCHRSKHPARHTPGHARASDNGTTIAPFSSTGCASGHWPFESRVTYKDKPAEAVDTQVACTTAPGAPPPATAPAPGPGCLPPLPCLGVSATRSTGHRVAQ
jgi:hypothetical protein